MEEELPGMPTTVTFDQQKYTQKFSEESTASNYRALTNFNTQTVVAGWHGLSLDLWPNFPGKLQGWQDQG